MRILKNELKKIFNLKIMFLLLIITVIMYNLYIIPSQGIRQGSDFINQMFIQMVNDYGENMDENEYLDFKEKYNEKVKEANDYLKNNIDFKKLKINNYEDFYTIGRNNGEEKYQKEELKNLYYNYIYHEEITLFKELLEMENIMIVYEGVVLKTLPMGEDEDKSPKILDREKEVEENGDIKALLPYTAFQGYNDTIKWVTNLILISVMILISPIYLKDKNNEMMQIQYSSKYGRKIFKAKFISTIIATLLMVSAHLALFFTVYLKQDVTKLLNCSISGFFNTPMTSWYNLTFKDYILVTIVCIYGLSIVISLISLFVSSKVNTNIALIGIQVPIAIFIKTFLLQFLVGYVTSIYVPINRLGVVRVPKYSLLIIYAIMILVSMLVTYYRYKKELKSSIQ